MRPVGDAGAQSVIGEPVLDTRDKSLFETLIASQAFWVTVALVIISGVMSIREPVFASEDNFFNITRNFAFIGIMALGMTPVIITGGIDLSVGSVMGVVAIVCGLVLLKQPIPWMPDWWNDAAWTHSWWMAVGAGARRGRDHRLHQRRVHRIRRPAALCRDAWHVVDRARCRGRSFRQSDALRFWAWRAGVQDHRRAATVSVCRCPFAYPTRFSFSSF